MWKKLALQDICTIKGRIGYRGYRKKDLVNEGDGAISLSPSNIKDNKLFFKKNTYISWEKYNESPEIMIYPGDIVFCKTASIGKMALVESLPEKTTLNPQFVVFKNIKCDNRFLFYYMMGADFQKQIRNIIVGTAIPTLTQKSLGETTIFLPPLSEQQRIVATLDTSLTQIDKMILNTTKNADNAGKLYQQILNNILNKKGPSWQSVPIRKACLFLQGVQVPVEKQSKIKDDKYNTRFLRIIDFTQGNQEPRYIKRTGKYKNFSKNDIALVRYGASTGFVCSGLEGQIANNMFKVIPNDSFFETSYLKLFLNSSIFKNFIKTKISGAAMPAINFEMFNEIKIEFPKNFKERQLLVKKAKKIFEKKNILVEIYANKLINLKALKMAIFSRELKSKTT